MKVILSLLLFISWNSQGAVGEKPESADNIVFTILYDNTAANDSMIMDHGFSCLIESGGHSCLFDAGRIPDKFMANASTLGVDCSRIDQVFVSHFHDDHMGGIFPILAACSKPILYLPFSYPPLQDEPGSDRADSDFKALLERLKPLVSEIVRKKESVRIGDGFHSTGTIETETYEQALIVSTSKGLIVVSGCAHPGILEIVKRAKELLKQDVYLVMGGFHLASLAPARVKTIARELRKLTKYVGPCHCTGEKARETFKEIFKEDYIEIKAGSKLKLGEDRPLSLHSSFKPQASLMSNGGRLWILNRPHFKVFQYADDFLPFQDEGDDLRLRPAFRALHQIDFEN